MQHFSVAISSRTYSNNGVKIYGGNPPSNYDVVYDPQDSDRTYIETDIPVTTSILDEKENKSRKQI